MFEQTSWVLFLKYLNDLEKDKATAAWKLVDGKLDYNAMSCEQYKHSFYRVYKYLYMQQSV